MTLQSTSARGAFKFELKSKQMLVVLQMKSGTYYRQLVGCDLENFSSGVKTSETEKYF